VVSTPLFSTNPFNELQEDIKKIVQHVLTSCYKKRDYYIGRYLNDIKQLKLDIDCTCVTRCEDFYIN